MRMPLLLCCPAGDGDRHGKQGLRVVVLKSRAPHGWERVGVRYYYVYILKKVNSSISPTFTYKQMNGERGKHKLN